MNFAKELRPEKLPSIKRAIVEESKTNFFTGAGLVLLFCNSERDALKTPAMKSLIAIL